MVKIGRPIQTKDRRLFHRPDKLLLIAIAALVISGLVFLSSASAVVAYTKFGSSDYFFRHQLFYLFFGLVLFYLFYRLDYHLWKKYAFLFLLLSCALLSLVFIPGLALSGGTANSWVNLFGFHFQPSEFVKIFFLIYLAAWLEGRRKELGSFKKGAGSFFFVLALISLLMILQPDFGTLFIIGASSLVVYFIGGGKFFHLFIFILLAALALLIAVQYKPYQLNRFKCAFDSGANIKTECYQLNQSLIAIGSGGALGRGLGQSRQKFLYLPQVYGDSIFAVVAEEIGFVFSFLVILLYLFLFYRLIAAAKKAPDQFGKLLAAGVASWLIAQTFLNIGGVIGLIPMTGIPLPLVSQGGSSLIASLIGLGIVLNISRQTTDFQN
jgi:cell division protein FtsW